VLLLLPRKTAPTPEGLFSLGSHDRDDFGFPSQHPIPLQKMVDEGGGE
jgi:hypothetical protein